MIAAFPWSEQTARILVVDDEPSNQKLLEVILSAEGYRVALAADGHEAIDLIKERQPDLILLDVMMAGMNGYQVASAIKSSAATAHIPIIVITALSTREARLLALGAGVEDFVSKPVDGVELCLRIKSLLRLKAYADHYDNYSQILEKEVASRTADLVERTEELERHARALTEQAALLDLAQEAILIQDMEDRILSWSRGAEVMYGWSSAEALGAMASTLLDEEVDCPCEQMKEALLQHGRWKGDVIHRTRNGNRINVEKHMALQRDSQGNPVKVLSLNADITERRQIDTERDALTERLSLATAVARVGVWEWDSADDRLTWDATMCDIYGFPCCPSIPYQRWLETVLPEDLPTVEATRRKAVASKGSGTAEFRITRLDGAVRHVVMVEKVVLGASGEVVRVIGVNMDVTERKVAERSDEQAREQEMRFKDDFLSHVSHELRSPLTAIKQFTTILAKGLAGELNEEQRQYEDIVLRNVHQLQTMVDDLLEVTRLETGKLTIELASVSVHAAVSDAVNTIQMTAKGKGITVSSELPEDIPTVFADGTRLVQILVVLLDNAVKFTEAGGAVVIRGTVEMDTQMVLLEVTDTGCGISYETSQRLFERLYQVSNQNRSSRKGLGLGLYICKELVTRLGGHISVKSKPGEGSTFSFTVPLFSMEQLVAPFIKDGRWPAASAALLTVRLSCGESASANAAGPRRLHEVQSFIQRCLLPNLDLLLPTRHTSREADCFFVAVFADEEGRSVLSNRIMEQFKHSRALNNAGRTLVLSYRSLPPFERVIESSTAVAAAGMAALLEDAVRSQTLAEGVRHEYRGESRC